MSGVNSPSSLRLAETQNIGHNYPQANVSGTAHLHQGDLHNTFHYYNYTVGLRLH